MNVKQLKALLKKIPDDTEVLMTISGYHQYFRSPEVSVTTGLKSNNTWSRDYGEAVTPEHFCGKRETVVLFE